MQFEITNAKTEELYKWKTHTIYDTVNNIDHKFITLGWVLSEEYVNSKLNVKARCVAKGFQKMFKTSYVTHPLVIKKVCALFYILLPQRNSPDGI